MWELQKDYLLGSDDAAKKWDIRFLGIYHDTDPNLDACKDLITGRMMAQWWDKIPESGPASREAEAFSVELPTLEILTTGSEGVQCLGFSTTVVFILNLVFSLKFDDFLPYVYLQSLGPLLGGSPTWCNKNTRAPIKMD